MAPHWPRRKSSLARWPSIIIGVLSLSSAMASAENISFTCATDKPPVTYKPGEPMVFTIQMLENDKPIAGRKLTWTRRGDDQKNETGEAISSDTHPLVIATSSDKPGFVHIAVSVLGEDGKPLKSKGQEVKWEGGATVQPEKLASVPEPNDFDAFWMRQKAKLKAVPVSSTMQSVPSSNPQFEVFDVKVDCPGGKPVSGYLTKPKGAAAKSLLAQVGFLGYGVGSSHQNCEKETLTFTINAHGIENGKDPEYYNGLQNGELNRYAFNSAQNADPEVSYFNGMMLRVMRSLEFIKSQPEWNGKELSVIGGSQGGLQALTAAGLDPDVTRCLAFKPWCCDLGGATLNRVSGWRPDWVYGLGYFDPVNHAKRIHCEIYLNAGLGDYTCPPSGIAVLYNNISAANKKIEYLQGATHAFDPPGACATPYHVP